MRLPFMLSLCLFVGSSGAFGQQLSPAAPQSAAPQGAAPQAVPIQPVPQTASPQPAPPQTAPPQPAPQPDPGTFNYGEPEPVDGLDLDSSQSLDLDSNQSFDFDDSSSAQSAPYDNSSQFQNSVSSNSNFRGASPQMIGDFGGGSTLLVIGGNGVSNSLSAPIPLAGGSRRIKIAENNQVMPLDRVYGTFNYYHNANQSVGAGPTLGTPVRIVESESLIQYTIGIEKTLIDQLFSIDVRMPLTSGVDQLAVNGTPSPFPEAPFSALEFETSGVGNLSTTLKAYLMQAGRTSISGGLQLSIPTGSDVGISFLEFYENEDFDIVAEDAEIEIETEAIHLMPFLGLYRPIGNSWWLQAFTQVDVPASGNDLRYNGEIVGRLTEQTLLYADVSLGKWWCRNPCNSRRCGGHGVTGIASLIELHYTSSLNDADDLLGAGLIPGSENRFDVLNMTAGLQIEISELWRINVAGTFPLREGRFDEVAGRQENRFFDSEFSLQINRFF